MSISYHEEEVMPIRKITSLPQGTFIGKVAIENDSPIQQPVFCGAIQIDLDEYARKEREAKEMRLSRWRRWHAFQVCPFRQRWQTSVNTKSVIQM